jgi:hypothetical protein
MPLTITGTTMRSTSTPRTASTTRDGGWSVSWLPERTLTRDQAISAMTIAETASPGLEPGDHRWPHVDSWGPRARPDRPAGRPARP